MTLITRLIATAAISASLSSLSIAEDYSKEEIESIVRDYILENPDIIADAIYILQERAEQERAQQQEAALQELSSNLISSNLDPVGGNPDGTITLVEFFDYNCGYCKRANDVVQTLIKQNPDLRVVYKEWPILSEASTAAAEIALAVNLAEPAMYETFHRALLSTRRLSSKADIWRIVEDLDLDRANIEAQLTSPLIEQHIRQSTELAQMLNITGTPAFVVGDQILRGAYPIEQIQQAIDEEAG